MERNSLSTKIGLMLALILCGQAAYASSDRVYMSPMEKSLWTLTVDDPLRCEIQHDIPRFGRAVFYQESGRSLQLRVETNHVYKKDMPIAFRSVTANWKGIQYQTELANLASTGSRALVDIKSTAARQAYFELEQGYQPSLFFRDEEDGLNQVAVILSTVNFRDVEAGFGACITRLHPYHFDDIQLARVHFEFDEEFPKEEEEDRALQKILDYIQLDPSVKTLLIEGHADFKGTECYNDSLSARRAWYVYDYLIQSDVDPKMLDVRFYGELKPRKKGRDDASRAANRRVTVRMLK
jgi:outer membrane protein OmpA-like peptidoglycan-associated protein